MIGPSGSGKSTFLRCSNHLETIDEGGIEIEGETLARTCPAARASTPPMPTCAASAARLGMVFQSFNLFPHMTVLQNVIEAPVTVKGLRRDAVIPKAEELLRKVGLLAKRDNYTAGCPAARSCHCPCSGHGAGHHAVRRAHLGARPELTGEVLRTCASWPTST